MWPVFRAVFQLVPLDSIDVVSSVSSSSRQNLVEILPFSQMLATNRDGCGLSMLGYPYLETLAVLGRDYSGLASPPSEV